MRPSQRRIRRRNVPRLEALEARRVLSAAHAMHVRPLLLPIIERAAVSRSAPYAFSLTPDAVRRAYGIDQISFGAGRPAANGAGETIAIVDAFNDPNIAADLAVFDSAFKIAPPPRLTVMDQNGPGAPLPGQTNANWALETALDVEWAHAIAPGANLLLVEANSDSLSDLAAAVRFAARQSGVVTVSMSWGFYEFSTETTLDSTFSAPGVTFVAAAGDDGGVFGPLWPAVAPNVLSVGGTTLSMAGGVRAGETAWSFSLLRTLLGFGAGGGGVSRFEAAPPYQQAVLAGKYAHRTSPDVAYVADPLPGINIYDSVPIAGLTGWFPAGGTSFGSPQWAALVAIADQGRALKGLGALSSSQTLSLLYGLAPTLTASTPSPYFHDITSGHSLYYAAGPGFDLVTGLGSPIANNLIPYLATARV